MLKEFDEAFRRMADGLARGEESAWTELYDHIGPALFQYALARLGRRADAEDVLQEVFARASRIGERIHEVREPRTWFYGLVRNESNRHHGKRRPVGSLDEAPEPIVETHTERDRAIADELSRLPPAQREVVTLRVWHRMTFAEIAELQGVPVDTASSRYRYGIQRLRSLMKEEEIGR